MLVHACCLPLTGPSLRGPVVELFLLFISKTRTNNNEDLSVILTVTSSLFLYNLSDPHQV